MRLYILNLATKRFAHHFVALMDGLGYARRGLECIFTTGVVEAELRILTAMRCWLYFQSSAVLPLSGSSSHNTHRHKYLSPFSKRIDSIPKTSATAPACSAPYLPLAPAYSHVRDWVRGPGASWVARPGRPSTPVKPAGRKSQMFVYVLNGF